MSQSIVFAFKSRRAMTNFSHQQVEWLIKVMTRLPLYMIARGALRDVRSMAVGVDGVEVGDGYMIKEQVGLGAPGRTSANVNVSNA